MEYSIYKSFKTYGYWAYNINANISTVTEIDSTHSVLEGFVKKTISTVKSFLMTLSLSIKKTDTNALAIQNDGE